MYSTVINSHPTVIRHEVPQPKGLGVHPATAAAFSVDPNQTLAEKEKMANGAYSIPVQMNAAPDANMNGYEVPNFLHKKEQIKESNSAQNQNTNGAEATANTADPAVFLKSSMEKDINEFTAQFDNTRDKAERIAACKGFCFYIFLFN